MRSRGAVAVRDTTPAMPPAAWIVLDCFGLFYRPASQAIADVNVPVTVTPRPSRLYTELLRRRGLFWIVSRQPSEPSYQPS
jgi:hypothetical protein